MRLAKMGYYGGDPDKVLDAPVSTVLKIIQFEAFENEYTAAEAILNRKEE